MSEIKFDAKLKGNSLWLWIPSKAIGFTMDLAPEIAYALRSLHKDGKHPRMNNFAILESAALSTEWEDRCQPVSEVARLTHLATTTIRRWCRNDKVRYLRRGKLYWPNIDDVIDYSRRSG